MSKILAMLCFGFLAAAVMSDRMDLTCLMRIALPIVASVVTEMPKTIMSTKGTTRNPLSTVANAVMAMPRRSRARR